MIQSLRLQNFKGIRDVNVGFERLTVFVGPNASGKTSFLQGLDLLVNTPELDASYKRRHLALINDFYRHNATNLTMRLSCTTQSGSVRLRAMPPSVLLKAAEVTSTKAKKWMTRLDQKGRDHSAKWVRFDELSEIGKSLGDGQMFRFDAGQMVQPSSEVAYRLTSDGRWVASTLIMMAADQPSGFARLQEMLSQIIPTITGVRLEKNPSKGDLGFDGSSPFKGTLVQKFNEALIFLLKDGRSIPARSASEGTLFVLGLLTVLVNKHRPNLILLDDLDRGLHPLAQRDVVALIRKVLDQQPDLQIVATTHSPYLVDSLRSEEVRLTTLKEDGTVACGRLDEHPDFPRWKDEFCPGELWSMFGEKWVADKTPEVAR